MLEVTKKVTAALAVLPPIMPGPAGVAVSVLRLAVLVVVAVDVVSEAAGQAVERGWRPWWS